MGMQDIIKNTMKNGEQIIQSTGQYFIQLISSAGTN